MDLKILMNHALPAGDVTEGYIRPSVEHLRESAERIAAFLMERASGSDGVEVQEEGRAFVVGEPDRSDR